MLGARGGTGGHGMRADLTFTEQEWVVVVEEGCGDDGGCTPLLSHPLPPEPSSLCPCTLDFIGICFQKKAAPHPTPPPLSLSPPLSIPLSLPVFGSLNFPPEKSPKKKREKANQ